MKLYKDFSSFESKLVLLTTILASTIGFFSATSIAIAIPNIQIQLGATIDQIQWVLYSFILVVSVGILVSGSLADSLGYKKILLWGIGIFTVANIGAMVSTNVVMLIISRAFQGLGAALIAPQSLAIINTLYDRKMRTTAIGYWSAASGLVTLFGPVLAGWLVDVGSWRWVFASVLPLCLVAAVLVMTTIPKSQTLRQFRLDWVGMSILVLSISSISLGFIRAQQSFGFLEASLIGGGAVMLLLFYVIEKRISQPLFDFKILSDTKVLIANIFTLLMYAPLTAITVLMPVYFQQLLGLTAIESSLYLLPLLLCLIIFAAISGKLADMYGKKVLMAMGAMFTLFGYLGLSFISTDYALMSVPTFGLVLVGIGFGLFIPALTQTALSVKAEFLGMASGVNNALSRFAGIVAVVIFGALLTIVFNQTLKINLFASSTLPPTIANQVWDSRADLLEIQIPSDVSTAQQEQLSELIHLSFVQGLRMVFLASIVLSIISGGLVLIRMEYS